MRFVNLTHKPIQIRDHIHGTGVETCVTLPPTTGRIPMVFRNSHVPEIVEVNGIEIYLGHADPRGRLGGMPVPDPEPGTLYIVDEGVARWVRRPDVVAVEYEDYSMEGADPEVVGFIAYDAADGQDGMP